MQPHKDIYAVIAKYLHNEPVALIQLARVGPVPYESIIGDSPLFPALLAANATTKCTTLARRVVPYKSIKPCVYSGFGREYQYQLT